MVLYHSIFRHYVFNQKGTLTSSIFDNRVRKKNYKKKKKLINSS